MTKMNKNEMLEFLNNSTFIKHYPTGYQEFYSSDSKMQFVKHLKKLPEDWEYRNKPVSYNFNRQGFRMKEFDDIDWDNYAVFLGCSHTVGVGLALEDTFSYKLGETLGIDVVNLAITAGSNDNMFLFFKKMLQFEKLPKFVVVNWTSYNRRTYRQGNENYLMIHNNGKYMNSWTDSTHFKKFDNKFKRYIIKDSYYKMKYLNRLRHIMEKDSKKYNIPLIQISQFWVYQNSASIEFIPDADFARDRSHFGIITNNNIYKYVLKRILEKEEL